MDKDPKPEARSLDETLVRQTIHDCLVESAQYEFDFQDLEDDLVKTIIDWFNAHIDQLQVDFCAEFPQAGPAQRDLIQVMRGVVPIERIRIAGVGPEFRRTQVLTHWAQEIYWDCIRQLFVKPL